MQKVRENIELDFDMPMIGVFNEEGHDISKKNKLVYYWNVPHCVYKLITPLMEYPVYNDYIVIIISYSYHVLVLRINNKCWLQD